MAGFGSPCGACKFLRRKCVRGCVFAPYFSHEQGAAHFTAIHKVFGASNVSKLLMHLPESDRSEAAVTISYEAQARLQDPIYGCVAHIFALQQQVVNLQAQLASFKDQAACGLKDGFGNAAPLIPDSLANAENLNLYNNGVFYSDCMQTPQNQPMYMNVAENSSNAMASLEMQLQASTWRSEYHDMEEFESDAYAYLFHQ
ncbi:LOB domain-containing protein CRL1-like [Typha angustifolia]|uniref:LOB domain-containing protein CRL1-like n=1 Tax=Typha angustifolia TaxID=59011 RepID=UPI003C2BB849